MVKLDQGVKNTTVKLKEPSRVEQWSENKETDSVISDKAVNKSNCTIQ